MLYLHARMPGWLRQTESVQTMLCGAGRKRRCELLGLLATRIRGSRDGVLICMWDFQWRASWSLDISKSMGKGLDHWAFAAVKKSWIWILAGSHSSMCMLCLYTPTEVVTFMLITP